MKSSMQHILKCGSIKREVILYGETTVKKEKGELYLKKYARQSKILKIIEGCNIETQEELSERLSALGIEITQATISRDIKELGLVKVLNPEGRYIYKPISLKQDNMKERLRKIFSTSIISITNAGSIIVIKTLPGAAQISAAAVDALEIPEVAGTLAGDDTVFIAISDLSQVENIKQTFLKRIEE